MKKFATVVVTVLIAASATACGADDGGEDGATQLLLLSQQTPFTAPSYFAEKLGYYDEANLDVEIRAFPTGTTALEAWKSGIGDVVYSGAQPALLNYGNTDGTNYRMIQIATRSEPALILMANRSITSAKDLEGKKIATRIGSTSEWWLQRYLAHNKVDTSKVEIINLDSQQMPPALEIGDIDAFALYQPVGWQSQAVSGDKVHQLADATEVPGVSDLTSYGVRPEMIEQNPEAAKAFVEATKRGADYVVAHPEEVGEFYATEFGANNEDTVRTIALFDFNPAFDEDAVSMMQDLVDWSVEHGALTAGFDINDVIWTEAAGQ
ncbi:ABC transporter substrate-binding protein [Mycolicibacterium smegmatis]|uniref:ABC transporter, periplasmic substrate-binding protein n=3 Tax=Mycolicibacterium smegmatis TaxID=1772 RepID=I7FIB2_MYCS2|nr:ABC transporter substrate-binding protein [Mycolicibacterium smegmatis]ABK72173.1 ABC transporter, substrate binding protein [nitrate/sulfonate], putative [Mycolicibacterium smegmatis MC2 155]AFP38523.1 ABC transporter, periplasmic substrate-binding protein [Mycolicibacterium smegmatis MC2 155]AIU07307.1 nitrate ABC transporter substrate-binding protein [Mycolicibacterium smegmatis MC2 155]AIU13932.1 nitrate ABC transporter substrate-binding protein [Mycolicibacterium smegmatis]AIU20556.1 n